MSIPSYLSLVISKIFRETSVPFEMVMHIPAFVYVLAVILICGNASVPTEPLTSHYHMTVEFSSSSGGTTGRGFLVYARAGK